MACTLSVLSITPKIDEGTIIVVSGHEERRWVVVEAISSSKGNRKARRRAMSARGSRK